MAEESAETEVIEEVEVSSGGSKLVVILTALNLLITLGVVGFLWMSFKKTSEPRVEDIAAEADSNGTEKKEGGGHGAAASKGHGEGDQIPAAIAKSRIIQLDQFTVNLSTAGTVTTQYARVDMSLEVNSEDAEAEIRKRLPQIRNTVIDLFNSKRPSDVSTVEGRNYLKEEIRNAINAFMVVGKVQGVYFTRFVLGS